MKTVSEQDSSTKNVNNYRAILFGGLLAGAMDLTAAFIVNAFKSGNYVGMLQSIASGLLGADSFKGGATTALLGVLTHFAIAFIWAIIFFAASRKIKFLTAQPIIFGIVYGILVYVLMYYVIVPLSAAPFKMPRTLDSIALNIFIHIVCVGLPIALITRRFSK